MNRQINNTPSTLTRALAATAALLLTTVVVSSNFRLADHYDTQAELANPKSVLLAGRE